MSEYRPTQSTAEEYKPETVQAMVATAQQLFDRDPTQVRTLLGGEISGHIRSEGVYQIDTPQTPPKINQESVDLEKRYLSKGGIMLFLAGSSRSLEYASKGAYWGLKIDVDRSCVLYSCVVRTTGSAWRDERPLTELELEKLVCALKENL